MVWRTLRKHGIVPLAIIIAAIAYWGFHKRAPKAISVGYVADRNVTLWNTLAQVKQPVQELHYGDRVEIVREEGTTVQVRAASGTVGWLLDSRQIMDSDLWGQSAALLAHAHTLPIQAHGQTKTVTNVRIEPGRNGKRIFQLMRSVPVVVLKRAVADAALPTEENSQAEKSSGAGQQKLRQEDWLLIMRSAEAHSVEAAQSVSTGNPGESSRPSATQPVAPSSGDPVSSGPIETESPTEDMGMSGPVTPIAGWVLARFVELNLPGPVKDYASSADLHVLAWFELNRVPDGSGGEVPQYLVAGSRGGEGQACDFTMLRVYTWGAARKRYETAYVESDLCGHLPIHASETASGPEFRFPESGEISGERTYLMHQTVVRRVKNDSEVRPPGRHKNP